MNASSFITFDTYMLRQNGIRFYKGLYVTFKLARLYFPIGILGQVWYLIVSIPDLCTFTYFAPDITKNTVILSSYSPLNEGHFIILANSMLRTYQ